MVRQWLLLAGLLALAVAWVGPLPALAHHAFFGHMIMHVLNVAVAAPLLSLAIAGSSFDPARRYPGWFAAVPASIVELIVVWTWHAPAPHHWARHSSLGLVAEQGMFLASGLWVWISAFGGTTEGGKHRQAGRSGAGIIGLLLTSMHMTLLGALLALAPRPLYEHHQGFAGMSPLEDQHLGGAVMLLVGGIAYLSGGLWLSRDLVRKQISPTEQTKS